MFSISKEAIKKLCKNIKIEEIVQFHEEDWAKEILKKNRIINGYILENNDVETIKKLVEIGMGINWDNLYDYVVNFYISKEKYIFLTEICPNVKYISNLYKKIDFSDNIFRDYLINFVDNNFDDLGCKRKVYKIIKTVGVYKILKVFKDNLDRLTEIIDNFDDCDEDINKFYSYCRKNNREDIISKLVIII